MVYVRQGHAAVSLIVKTISLVFNHKYRRERESTDGSADFYQDKEVRAKARGGHVKMQVSAPLSDCELINSM
jgi:hypothetical protein